MDIEFLVIWLALYSRYESYILQFVQFYLRKLSLKVAENSSR